MLRGNTPTPIATKSSAVFQTSYKVIILQQCTRLPYWHGLYIGLSC